LRTACGCVACGTDEGGNSTDDSENVNALGPNPVRTKASLIFSLFDFHSSGSITMDECTILFLSVLRAVHVIIGREGDEVDDELMEQFTLAVYTASGKSPTDPNQTVGKKDFCSWATSWLEDGEPTLEVSA